DRFSKDNERRIPAGAFIPFGWGPRICTGRALALVEVPFFISEIIKRFRIEVTNLDAVEPAARLTIQPKRAILCGFRPISAGLRFLRNGDIERGRVDTKEGSRRDSYYPSANLQRKTSASAIHCGPPTCCAIRKPACFLLRSCV